MLLSLFYEESTVKIGLVVVIVHSDCKCVVVQDADIGVPAGEGMKTSDLGRHGAGRGSPAVGTPDKVGQYA